MKTRIAESPPGLIALALPALALLLVATSASAAVRAEDEAMLRDVYTRLLSVIDPPPGMQWPPELHLLDTGDINACAYNESQQPGVVKPGIDVNRGIIERVAEGHPDRLAFIVGHELGHILRGHIIHVFRDPKNGTMFLHTTFSRENELEADQMGIKLALKAGYRFRDCVKAMGVLADSNMEYSAFRAGAVGHPSWKERLIKVDREHAAVWSTMAAFHNGVDFLEFEQFVSAASCFEEVVKQFPECPEGWANLGYAQLMQYCDTLKTEDLRQLDINQMVIGGFYHRPDWLRGQVDRGDSKKLWAQAKTSLEKALSLRPELSLTKANLGVAWLVAPDGKDVSRASKFLHEAVQGMGKDGQMVPSIQAAVLVNAGVVDLAGGEDERAQQRMVEAMRLMSGSRGVTKAAASSLQSAVLYNQAFQLSNSSSRENRSKAIEFFQEYFKSASPSGAWWPLAYERYAKVASGLGLPVASAKSLQARATELKRPVTGVTLEGGIELTLGQPLAEAQKRLGNGGIRIPLIPDTNLVAISYPERGIRLIGVDTLLAIRLTQPVSPAVMVRPVEIGSQAKPVRVGMPLEELDPIVGPQRIAMEAVFEPGERYVVYRDLQLALRVNEGKIAEIVVALIPETPKEEKE